MRPNRRTGFTLIELLTVMFIMSLLAGLLLPAVMAARQAAWKTKCVSHLHNLGIALQAHATQHAGAWPERQVSLPNQVSAGWKSWFLSEANDPNILYCPSGCRNQIEARVHEKWDPVTAPEIDYEILVGSDSLGSRAGKWLSLDQVPANEMIAGDLLAKDNDPSTAGWKANHVERGVGGTIGKPQGRNALYADNHVEWFALDRTDDRVYYTGGASATYYLPEVIKP